MRDRRHWTLKVRQGIATLFSTLLVLAPAVAYGQSVTAVWDPSPPAEQVTGYQVCVSTSSMACNVQLASVSSSSASYAFAPSAGVLHYIAVRATNSLGTGPYSSEVAFSIPSFATPATQNSYVGAAITPLNMSVTDPDGSPKHFTHTGLPVGLSLNATTGQITGAASTAGTYIVTIFVDDGLVTVQRSFTWNVTMAVSAVSTAPSAGSGNSQSFALQYSDTLGVTDLATARVRFGVGSSGAGTCTVSYTRGSGAVALQNDAGTGFLPAGAFGSGTLSNSQCTVNLASSSASTSGNTLTMTLAITFNSSFAGAKSIFMLATSNGGASTGWQSRGSWTVTASAGGVASAVSVTPGSGSGSSGTFVMLYSDTGGAADLANGKVRFVPTSVSGPGTSANNCNVSYDQSANTVSLSNDAGTSSTVGTVGSGTLSNSQCSVNLASSSASLSGNNMTVTLAMTFTASFQGAKNVYMRAQTDAGVNTDWQLRGTWTVPPPAGPGVPSVVSVTPGSGSGASGTFVLLYSDTVGASDLGNAKVRVVSTSVDGANTSAGTCTASYDPDGNSLSLQNDAGTAWVAGTIGSGTLSNSQCTINLATSTVVASGNNLTLTLPMTFSANFAGAKNIFMRANTDAGTRTDWLQRGTWTVPQGSTPGTPSVVSVTPFNGAGRSGNFVLNYSDTGGAADLATARVRFVPFSAGGSGNGANTCTVNYNRSAGTVTLLNNAGNAGPVGTIGTGTLANSQCTVNLATSSVSTNGNNLTVTLAITFSQTFNGAKRTYMLATTQAGTSTGWIQRGQWIVQ